MKEISKVGVIGKGRMGSDIFYHILQYDYSIVWFCRKPEDIEFLNKNLIKYLDKALRREFITQEEYSKKRGNILISNLYSDFKDCDLVIESIVEDKEIKQNIFAELENIVSNDCLLVSNTSSIPLPIVFKKCKNKARCFGFHFFFPLKLIKTIEVNKLENFSSEAIERLKNFAFKIEKFPLEFEEKANFTITRIYLLLISQAYAIYEEGYFTIAEIDGFIKNNLFPFGLLEIIDAAGIDIILEVIENFSIDRYKKLHSAFLKKLKFLYENEYRGGGNNKGLQDYENEHLNKEQLKKCEDIAAYNQYIKTKLLCLLINEMAYYIWNGFAAKDDIGRAFQEILGLSEDPFVIFSKLGYINVYNNLIKYYQKTKDELYKPIEGFFKAFI